jgi:hypothetical protein
LLEALHIEQYSLIWFSRFRLVLHQENHQTINADGYD